jgi:hypothetical protein
MNFLWALLIMPLGVFASDCRVDGITDSPQKINCYLHVGMLIKTLDVECREGNYQIVWEHKVYDVNQAYHEEVERGSNPLVFQADRLSLTTKSYQIYSRADLKIDGDHYDGLCFNK